MKKLNHFPERKSELINYYEELRDIALRKLEISENGAAGYSILLFRGMPAWINTYLSSELTQAIQTNRSHFEVTSDIEKEILNFPHDIHKEVMIILTNMVLSHQ